MATEIIDVAKAYGLALIELGKKNSLVVTVETDLADSCMSDLFRVQFPERSVEVGLAEATAVEVGAGYHTGSTFLERPDLNLYGMQSTLCRGRRI